MKFLVKVGYNKYLFDDSAEALSFAITAIEHNVEEDKSDRDVRIKLIKDGEEIE